MMKTHLMLKRFLYLWKLGNTIPISKRMQGLAYYCTVVQRPLDGGVVQRPWKRSP